MYDRSQFVRPLAGRNLPQRFWCSDKLTGISTYIGFIWVEETFWGSDKLTGISTLALGMLFDVIVLEQ